MEVPQITFSPEKKKPLKIGSSEYFSANDFSLTKKEVEKARIELFETEEKKTKNLQELRNLLAKDKDVNYRTDTTYLLRFLRIRKYDSMKAYKFVKERYLFRRKNREIFQIPGNLTKLLNIRMINYLPYTNEDGVVMFYCRMEKWNWQETAPEELMQLYCMIGEIISMNPRMQVNGTIGIWNAKGYTRQHFTCFMNNIGPRMFLFYIQNLFPWRMKKLLVINSGPIFRLLYRLIRPFISKKLSERVVLLGSDIKELHKYVNPVLLPKELGGTLDENQYDVAQNVIDNIPYLKYDWSFD